MMRAWTVSARVVVAICAAVCSVVPRSHGQALQWEPTQGPYGAYVSSLATKGEVALAGTPCGLYRSTDAGNSWNRFPLNASVNALAIGPTGLMYMSEGAGAPICYRSTDLGLTWQSVRSFQSRVVAILTRANGLVVLVEEVGKIHLSRDFGLTWEMVGSGLPQAMGFAVAADTSGRLFVGMGSGVYRSTDEGVTWDTTPLLTLPAYEICVSRNGYVFVLARDLDTPHFYRSTNHGETWTELGAPTSSFFTFTVDPFDNLLAVASLGVVVQSSDFGVTWASVDTIDFALTKFATDNQTVLAASYGRGVFRLAGNGSGFLPSSRGMRNTHPVSIFPHASGRILAGTSIEEFFGAGLQISSDRGESWVQSSILMDRVRALAMHPSGVLVAGTSLWPGGELRRSTDGGIFWETTSTLSCAVKSLCSDATGNLYAGTEGCGILRSTDTGLTWFPANIGYTDVWVSEIAAHPSGVIFAGTNWGCFRSTDLGASWVRRYIGPGVDGVGAVACKSTGEVYAGVGGISGYCGVYVSTNLGDSWTQRGFGDASVHSFVFDSHGNVFASVSGAVVKSTNDGVTWVSEELGLPGATILDLAIDGAGYLYAGTYGYGLYRTTTPVTSVSPSPDQTPRHFALDQNYPNPFNPTTKIVYSVGSRESIELSVYDVLGRRIATLVNEVKSPGTYEATWDASGMASGVYFCRLWAGSFVQTRKLILNK